MADLWKWLNTGPHFHLPLPPFVIHVECTPLTVILVAVLVITW